MDLKNLQKEIEKLSFSEQQLLADSILSRLDSKEKNQPLNLSFIHGEIWEEEVEADLSENHDDYLYEDS